jgi:2-keto-4-pentenoate hydratase/2-oxohepta-3-ene-1,7-dioic acid hydratase in catechol pathway
MKIFCVGRNYVDHAKELNNPLPQQPVVFTKPPTAVIRNGQDFYIPDFSKNVHYEGELVIRIGKNGKNIAEKFAHKYVDAITFGLDFTARDLQDYLKENKLPWDLAKGFDGSAAVGDWLPIDQFPNLHDISFRTVLNGETVQNGNSSLMMFNIERIISFVSSYFTLQVGDLLYTGTPAGVGCLKAGDVLEGYIGEEKLLKTVVK